MTQTQPTDTVTVRDMAVASLDAVRIFEKYGIDYCCGGKRPLADVCLEKGYNAATIQSELDAAASARSESGQDWNAAPLHSLIRHIVSTHHEYLRRELPAIEARLTKVYRVYNERYGPTLIGLPEVFGSLKSELESHIAKEELILFPAIEELESAADVTRAGFALSPIAVMEEEHDSAGRALARIRDITGSYHVPETACVTYRALMKQPG